MIRLILFSALLLTACDRRIEIKREAVTRDVREISCTHYGYCLRCGLGFDGEFSCGFGWSSLCSGKQQAMVRTDRITYQWEESREIETRLVDQVIERYESCK